MLKIRPYNKHNVNVYTADNYCLVRLSVRFSEVIQVRFNPDDGNWVAYMSTRNPQIM